MPLSPLTTSTNRKCVHADHNAMNVPGSNNRFVLAATHKNASIPTLPYTPTTQCGPANLNTIVTHTKIGADPQQN